MNGGEACLRERIAAEIHSSGPIPFDRYMALALLDSAGGYYAAGRARIGRHGDFYTNVSVGAVYGRVLAGQFAEMWEQLGRPPAFQYIEEGANDGAFASDMLSASQAWRPRFFKALQVTLIEPFPALRQRQAGALSAFAEKVRWIRAIEELDAFEGVHFTNEYVDALPVKLMVRKRAGWLERHVAVSDGKLVFVDLPPGAMGVSPKLPENPPEGYLAEVRPEALTWISGVAAKLIRGFVLIVDYGLARADLHSAGRRAGTLSCFQNHRRDFDPLDSPGAKDITAHVDWTSLAEEALRSGLDLAGFTDQHHFLVGASESLLRGAADPGAHSMTSRELRQLRTLLHPEMMGTAFKYLCFSRSLSTKSVLQGFRHARDPVRALGLEPFVAGIAQPSRD